MKKGKWKIITDRSDQVHHEMHSLQLVLNDVEVLQQEDQMVVKAIEIKLRRLQRLLRVHMNCVESDIDVLDNGLRKVKRSIAEIQS